MKIAVVYYSLEGNTKYVSEIVKDKLNADIFEIKPIKNNINKNSFSKFLWGGKQVMMKETPEIEEIANFNPENYDIIFIGTPVWAFTYCPPIRTFFKKYKFNNKKVVVFCQHDGGKKDTLKDMKDALPGNEFIGEFDVIGALKDTEKTKEKVLEYLSNLNV